MHELSPKLQRLRRACPLRMCLTLNPRRHDSPDPEHPARDDTRGDAAAWTDTAETDPDPAEARHLEAHAHSARGTQCLTKLANILAADDAC